VICKKAFTSCRVVAVAAGRGAVAAAVTAAARLSVTTVGPRGVDDGRVVCVKTTDTCSETTTRLALGCSVDAGVVLVLVGVCSGLEVLLDGARVLVGASTATSDEGAAVALAREEVCATGAVAVASVEGLERSVDRSIFSELVRLVSKTTIVSD
jgi:hypothetical protein